MMAIILTPVGRAVPSAPPSSAPPSPDPRIPASPRLRISASSAHRPSLLSRITHHASRFTLPASLLLCALCFLCFSQPTRAATFDELFRQGSQAYVAGGFEQAASYFRDAVTLSPSAGALHNLGNAEWQTGRAGEAILAWERAQLFNPYSANTRANLRFARKAAQLDGPNLAWFEVCSTWLPINAWPWIAGASFWLAISMVMLPGIFHWRKADWHQALAAGGFALFLLTIPALIGVQTRSNVGVIRVKDTALRLTPTHDAQTLARLPAGEMVRLERERGQYVYIRTAGDAAGWVQREQFGRIAGH